MHDAVIFQLICDRVCCSKEKCLFQLYLGKKK